MSDSPIKTPRIKLSPEISFLRNVIFKGLFLFIIFNLVFAASGPVNALSRLSIYNHLVPGRERLPFGERPDLAYNLSLYQIDAMFASHELSAGEKPANEYRVLVMGDSSVWGILLRPSETLAGYLDTAGYYVPDGRQVRVYNLGYPTMSLTKDLLILSEAMKYQPDLIVWMITLESFPTDKQLSSPIVQNNPTLVRELIQQYQLPLDPADPSFVTQTFLDQTIFGQRRALADLWRLQMTGFLWAGTGIDQVYPQTYEKHAEDLEADDTFKQYQPPLLPENALAFDVLAAGVQAAGKTPVLFVNEPMYISTGKNSDIRYNFFYPRWAYDQYREDLQAKSLQYGWHTLDLWDLISANQFTNSALHLTPTGSAQLATRVGKAILDLVAGKVVQ